MPSAAIAVITATDLSPASIIPADVGSGPASVCLQSLPLSTLGDNAVDDVQAVSCNQSENNTMVAALTDAGLPSTTLDRSENSTSVASPVVGGQVTTAPIRRPFGLKKFKPNFAAAADRHRGVACDIPQR